MPFYEYECSSCKFYVEALQKISDPPMVNCPSCGKPTLQRLVSAPNFRLKGSGWYETDFKSDKENKRNIADGEDKPAESKEEDAPKVRAPRRPAATKLQKKVKSSIVKKAAKKAAKKKSVKKPAGNKRGKANTKMKQQSTKKQPAKKKAARKK